MELKEKKTTIKSLFMRIYFYDLTYKKRINNCRTTSMSTLVSSFEFGTLFGLRRLRAEYW